MSDNTVEQMTNEQEPVEQIEAGQLAETGVSNSESLTQGDTETEQAEVEQIDLSALAGTQPETTEKEHNNIDADNRVKTKRLKDLEAQQLLKIKEDEENIIIMAEKSLFKL